MTMSNDQQENVQKPISLIDIRDQISAVDNELLALLARRRGLSQAVAINKQGQEKPVRDPSRESQLLDKLVTQAAVIGLDAHYITRIFHTIIEDSVLLQQAFLQRQTNPELSTQTLKRIAVLGGSGSYSYLAANKHFSESQNNYLGCSSFEKVIESVTQEKADFGVLPIENTTSGGITEVYDLLLKSNLAIIGEQKYLIEHCLVTNHNTELAQITQVLAHPQAARQCSDNLEKLLSVTPQWVSSTAEALKQVCEDKTGQLAAIASAKSAKQFGLKVMQAEFANLKGNTTRFLILAQHPKKVSAQIASKTSIALSTGQQPGSLVEVLQVFKNAGLLLTKLESRPIAGRPWEQMFYIDFEGNTSDTKVIDALDMATKLCRFLKVLGCYPAESIEATPVSTEALAKAKLLADQTQSNSLGATSNPSEQELKPSHSKSSGGVLRLPEKSLVGRNHKSSDTIIQIKGTQIGGDLFAVVASANSAKSSEQLIACAKHAKETGAVVFKQTPDEANSGLSEKHIHSSQLSLAGDKFQLPIIAEIHTPEQIPAAVTEADILELRATDMQNENLLRSIGNTNTPIILRRGVMATITEWLAAAEIIMRQGNFQVILCESGVRSFDNTTGNILDLSAIPLIKQSTHLPIIVDPYDILKGTELLTPIAKAIKAVGAHGIVLNIQSPCAVIENKERRAATFAEFSQVMYQLYT